MRIETDLDTYAGHYGRNIIMEYRLFIDNVYKQIEKILILILGFFLYKENSY